MATKKQREVKVKAIADLQSILPENGLRILIKSLKSKEVIICRTYLQAISFINERTATPVPNMSELPSRYVMAVLCLSKEIQKDFMIEVSSAVFCNEKKTKKNG